MFKKLFSFVAAALMSASLFAAPVAVPTVQDVATAGFDVTNARVIVLYFDEQVCNDIVWAGSYNEWTTIPDDMIHFEPLENYPGWYVVELWDSSEAVRGKPVQLKSDGSFDYKYQAGDPNAWINMAQPGSKMATIVPDQDTNEADCTFPETGAYIYEVQYFKLHNTPCGAPKHNYYITAYLPDFCDEIAAYADSVRVMGGFDEWSDGVWMTKTSDEDFNMIWTAVLNDVEEGTAFKLRFGTDSEWAVQVRKDGQNLGNETTGETTDIVLHFDGEGYDFAACTAPEEGDQFVDETSGLKFEVTAVGEANTVKVIDNNYSGTSYTIPATVNYNNVDFAVTEIGAEAFYECLDLQIIIIPESVTTIGKSAFQDCESLESITIPEGVTTIGTSAFQDCSSLESVTIPASVTTIGWSAFHSCSSLQSVTLSEGLLTIEMYAFAYCSSLESITLPEGLLTIGEGVFILCESLQSIAIPASVTEIGKMAFNVCPALQSITLSEGLLTIGQQAFGSCTSLQSITFPASVTEIGRVAFYGCTGLTSVTFLGNACQDAIGDIVFEGVGEDDPAALTLPANWTGSKPDKEGNWYGGKFELVTSALPTLFGDDVKGNKFLHNGQVIIRKDGKTYNTVGMQL